MKTMSKKSYSELQADLAEILQNLQNEELDIDEAFKNYEKGEKILKELESQLKQAENKLKRLTS